MIWTLGWTGPDDGDCDACGTLLRNLPPSRWPYGPPEAHEDWCLLRACSVLCDREGDAKSGTYCDCDASDASA